MAAKLEEITAKYLGERHRWGETAVIELNVPVTGYTKAKGPADEGDLEPDLWYRFWGRWEEHWRHGRQFSFQGFVPERPLDDGAKVRYLCRAPNVGKTIAGRLVKRYGDDAVRMLREQPEECAREIATRGFTEAAAKEAASFLAENASTEKATIDLVGLFAGRSLPRKLPKKCLQTWGNRASDQVRADPYLLLRFQGVGFAKADELYIELGHDPHAIRRQALCMVYRCHSDTSGDTWIDAQDVLSELYGKVGATAARPLEAAQYAIAQGLLEHRQEENGRRWFAEAGRAQAERRVAQYVGEMLHYSGTLSWPAIDELDVTDHQREELAKALTSRIGIFGGCPGTGKTYTAARLIAAIQKEWGRDAVAVVAPTGKAAVRITEALAEYGIGIRARTIHSFLGVARANEEAEEFAFSRGPDSPFEERFIVVDESSMIDTPLMASLLGAIRMEGHLLLVGDVHQLPPVGHGAPLRDLIRAGIPCGDLTKIQRNDGAIVRTCQAIRQGRVPPLPGRLELETGGNLMLRSLSAGLGDEIVRLVQAIQARGEHDPVWDVQILVAVNEKSPLSRQELNRVLQATVNLHNRPLEDAPFWRRDKVVCLKNSFFPAIEEWMDGGDVDGDVVVQEGDDGKPRVYVANGELGRVLEDEPKRTIVEFFAPRRIVIVPKGGTDSIDLGYALSTHKSQGSEWPIVIVGLDDYAGARLVCDRSWLYTAISRAKKACVLVGLESTARGMCERQKIDLRKTFLVESVAHALVALRESSKSVEEVEEDACEVEAAAG